MRVGGATGAGAGGEGGAATPTEPTIPLTIPLGTPPGTPPGTPAIEVERSGESATAEAITGSFGTTIGAVSTFSLNWRGTTFATCAAAGGGGGGGAMGGGGKVSKLVTAAIGSTCA